jgi:DNA-binding transcriptional regulator YhcF (GntR family)
METTLIQGEYIMTMNKKKVEVLEQTAREYGQTLDQTLEEFIEHLCRVCEQHGVEVEDILELEVK